MTKKYFVKRFASKDAANQYLRTKLTIEYNDAIIDNHNNIEFAGYKLDHLLIREVLIEYVTNSGKVINEIIS